LNQNTSVTFGGASNFALSFGDNVGPGPAANVRLGNTASIAAAQTANAQFGGSVSYPVRIITANYTLANDDYTVLCNNAANVAVVTITPPAAGPTNRGRVYVVKRINPSAGGTNDNCALANVEGVALRQLTEPGGVSAGTPSGLIIQSDGSAWWIIGLAP